MAEPSKVKGAVGTRNLDKKRRPYVPPVVTVKQKLTPEQEARREKVRNRKDTERGHSPELTRALRTVEETTRNKKDEELTVFNNNGKQVFHKQGKGAKVQLNIFDALALQMTGQKEGDLIATHNHPRGIPKDKFGNIGHSFSGADIDMMVGHNFKEMRAATPTFTYSLKRPEGGWGASPSEIKRVMERITKEVNDEAFKHDYKRDRLEVKELKRQVQWSTSDRTDVWVFNEINKRLAEHFGWEYTRSQQHKTKGWGKPSKPGRNIKKPSESSAYAQSALKARYS